MLTDTPALSDAIRTARKVPPTSATSHQELRTIARSLQAFDPEPSSTTPDELPQHIEDLACLLRSFNMAGIGMGRDGHAESDKLAGLIQRYEHRHTGMPTRTLLPVQPDWLKSDSDTGSEMSERADFETTLCKMLESHLDKRAEAEELRRYLSSSAAE
jgi:hypothetical protein